MDPVGVVGALFSGGQLVLMLRRAEEAKKGGSLECAVILYLRVCQEAVKALGQERQRLLTQAASADADDPDAIRAVRERLRVFLTEDNIRPQLVNAIAGLEACRPAVEQAAGRLRWRRRDRQRAAELFTATIEELQQVLARLVNNLKPEYTGVGVATLHPILDFVERVDGQHRAGHAVEREAEQEELARLIESALTDPANGEWLQTGGKVETLINKLNLSFDPDVCADLPASKGDVSEGDVRADFDPLEPATQLNRSQRKWYLKVRREDQLHQIAVQSVAAGLDPPDPPSMTSRLFRPATSERKLVLFTLGIITTVLIVGIIILVLVEEEVDAAIVAPLTTLAGTGLGFIGGMVAGREKESANKKTDAEGGEE